MSGRGKGAKKRGGGRGNGGRGSKTRGGDGSVRSSRTKYEIFDPEAVDKATSRRTKSQLAVVIKNDVPAYAPNRAFPSPYMAERANLDRWFHRRHRLPCHG